LDYQKRTGSVQKALIVVAAVDGFTTEEEVGPTQKTTNGEKWGDFSAFPRPVIKVEFLTLASDDWSAALNSVEGITSEAAFTYNVGIGAGMLSSASSNVTVCTDNLAHVVTRSNKLYEKIVMEDDDLADTDPLVVSRVCYETQSVELVNATSSLPPSQPRYVKHTYHYLMSDAKQLVLPHSFNFGARVSVVGGQ
jgi:hypothetical protein